MRKSHRRLEWWRNLPWRIFLAKGDLGRGQSCPPPFFFLLLFGGYDEAWAEEPRLSRWVGTETFYQGGFMLVLILKIGLEVANGKLQLRLTAS